MTPREEVDALVEQARETLKDTELVQSPAQAAHMVNSCLSRVGPHLPGSRDDTAQIVQAIALMFYLAEHAHVNMGKIHW